MHFVVSLNRILSAYKMIQRSKLGIDACMYRFTVSCIFHCVQFPSDVYDDSLTEGHIYAWHIIMYKQQ